MKMRIVFLSICLFVAFTGSSQVKIGSNPGSVNPAAILELSNDVTGSPANLKSFLPPKVDFTNAVFTSSSVWGIAGSPTDGAIVYNIGERFTNGFSGAGLYCWHRYCWAFTNLMVIDKIRQSLSTSIAAYDAAAINNWVNVTAAEYNNLLNVVNGAAKYATAEFFMNTTPPNYWTLDFTVGGSMNAIQVPASSYIIAWSVRTGTITSTSLNSKLKVSSAQTSGYVTYGSSLPNIGTIPANTRTYFVLKTPNNLTPSLPSFTAVYNATNGFLGSISGGSSGPEYYGGGDVSNPTVSFPSDSYSQVIGTQLRQW